MRRKAYQIYRSFEDWVRLGRHSNPSISSIFECKYTDSNKKPAGCLENYVSQLRMMRDEIDSEISEAEDWALYFKRRRRGING